MHNRGSSVHQIHFPASKNKASQVGTPSTSNEQTAEASRHGKAKVDEIERLRSQIAELRAVITEQTGQSRSHHVPQPTDVTPALNAITPLLPLNLTENVGTHRECEGKHGSVIKHLGRLVSVAPGQEVFAGSTTGVHFVRSVEQKWQLMADSSQPFLEVFFKMHLLVQPAMLYPFPNSLCSTDRPGTISTSKDLGMPEEYYMGRLQRYLSRWNTIFPMFCLKQFLQTFSLLLSRVKRSEASTSDIPELYCLFLILAVDAWDAYDLADGEHALWYYRTATKLESEALEVLNLQTVQSRTLKVLYLHLSGKHALIASEMGWTVRAAQCVGLHRQSRRFKFCAGEAENRTRLWWCVSILDT